jgi:hypothetical protein
MAYSKLQTGGSTFDQMMNAFGVVTVMNAHVYELDDACDFKENTASQIRDHYKGLGEDHAKHLAFIDTLKVANITVEGPNKTVTGGQYSNPLIKFGKSARLEMQDALGRADAIEAFGGAINEYVAEGGLMTGMHVTEDFAPTRLIIGESFFIDRKTGRQVKVDVIFYQVLPDSIFNLTQDAEGDATVFDMNADLLTTEILIGHDNEETDTHGVFYSVIEHADTANVWAVNTTTLAVTKNGQTVSSGVAYSVDGSVWTATAPVSPTKGSIYNIRVSESGVIVYSTRVTVTE